MQTDRYSQMVGWLKVLLPLIALGILSTLFLLSRVVDPEAVVPFADKEIQDRLRDQQVTGPVYSGVTADGDQLSFSAEKLTTPDIGNGTNLAQDVSVVMDLVSGSQVTLTSDQGLFDLPGNRADLDGNVVITTSTGYRVQSEQLISRLSSLDVESPGPVTGDGPFGVLNAGAMRLTQEPEQTAAQLVFTNGVKLVYDPNPNDE